jgi:hypothetical protein
MARASGYPDAQGLGLWFPALGCNYIWDFGLYADGGINIHAVHQTSDGSLVIVGAYADTVGLTPEALLWKVTLDPPSEIFRLIGDQSHEDDAYDFVETPTGYLLAGSTYDGQMNGLFLTKTDTDGNPEWIHRFTSQFVDQWAEAIIPANGGGYVIAGTTGTYLYGTDMLLVKVNDDGDIVWQKNYGSDVDERAYDVVQTSDGGFVLVGYSTAHQGVGAEWYIVKTLPDPDLATPEPSLSLPQQFTLSAFPNPFNPATNLTFSLPQSNHVSLSVYDMGGRLVKNLLVNQLYSAGEHRFTFDASALPSGIYFARVHAGNFVKTQKLLLLK